MKCGLVDPQVAFEDVVPFGFIEATEIFKAVDSTRSASVRSDVTVGESGKTSEAKTLRKSFGKNGRRERGEDRKKDNTREE